MDGNVNVKPKDPSKWWKGGAVENNVIWAESSVGEFKHSFRVLFQAGQTPDVSAHTRLFINAVHG